MKSYEIVGWTLDGAIYCTLHKPIQREMDRDEVTPVFLDDAISTANAYGQPDCCDVASCREPLIED